MKSRQAARQAAIEASGRGGSHAKKGDYDAAIRECDEVIRLDPKCTVAFFNRGLCHAEKGDYDAAIRDNSEAIRLDPKYAPAFHRRGISYFKKGEYDSAFSDFTQAVGLGNSDQIEQAQVCEVQGREREAQKYYLEALQKNANQVYKLYAYIQLEKLEYKGEEVKRPNLPSDDKAEALVVLMLEALHRRDTETAKTHARKLLTPQFLFQVHSYLQMDFMSAKEQLGLSPEMKEGAEGLRMIVRLKVLEREYVHYQGQYHFHRKQYKKALEYFNRGIRLGDTERYQKGTPGDRARSVALNEYAIILVAELMCATENEAKKDYLKEILAGSYLYHIPKNLWQDFFKDLPLLTAGEYDQIASSISSPAIVAALIQSQAGRLSESLNQNQKWRIYDLVTALLRIQGVDEFVKKDVATSTTYKSMRTLLIEQVKKDKSVISPVAEEVAIHHPMLKRDKQFAQFQFFTAKVTRDELLRTTARVESLPSEQKVSR